MSVENFIPTIWSADILREFDANLVFNGLVNRDYEGEIRAAGDTVKINSLGPVEVKDYVKNSTTLDYETLQDASQVLQITESKHVAFQVDDVDAAQANANLRAEATRNMGVAFAENVDGFIAGKYTDAHASNVIGTDASPKAIGYASSGNIDPYKQIVDLGVALDDQKVPQTGRWLVIPPWFDGMLRKSPQFVANPAGITGAVIVNGLIGTIAGFSIYKTTQLKKNGAGTVWRCMFGTNAAISLAVQKEPAVEAFRLQSKFADAVRALTLYGGKVVRPAALGVLYASKGSDS